MKFRFEVADWSSIDAETKVRASAEADALALDQEWTAADTTEFNSAAVALDVFLTSLGIAVGPLTRVMWHIDTRDDGSTYMTLQVNAGPAVGS